MKRLEKLVARVRHSAVARNAGWMFLGQGLSLVCQAGYLILVARLLGSTEYGRYVGALAMASMLSQYSSLGSREVLFRHVSQAHDTFREYWGNVVVMTVGLGCVFAAALTIAGPHIAHSYSGLLLCCVALGDCLFAQLTAGAGRAFQVFEKMQITAGMSVAINLLRVLLAAAMLWRFQHGTAEQWSIASLVVSAIATIAALALVTRILGSPRFSPGLLRERTGEGFVFALSYSTDGVYNNIDKAMLGHYGMNAANGIYTTAYRVIDVSTAPITSIHSATFPTFFRKGAEGVRSTAQYARQILKKTAPLGLGSAVLLVLLAPVVPHLLGKGFRESVEALRWLCLLPLFRSFQLSAGDAVTGAGYQNVRLRIQAGAAAFNFAVNLYLIPHYSWRGAAWSSLATDGLLGAMNWAALLWLMSAAVPLAADSRVGDGVEDVG
jgi:O-antigen/teichoic acid export membrane protein